MRPTSKGSQLTGRCQASTTCSAGTAAEEARIREEDGQASLGSPEPDEEAQNQSSTVLVNEPQAVTAVLNGMYCFLSWYKLSAHVLLCSYSQVEHGVKV